MIDYYLKAADQASMESALVEAGVAEMQPAVLDETGEVIQPAALVPTPGNNISVIGPWFERTGGTDEAPIMTQVHGYHVNVRSVAEVVFPVAITVTAPVTPWRVWA